MVYTRRFLWQSMKGNWCHGSCFVSFYLTLIFVLCQMSHWMNFDLCKRTRDCGSAKKALTWKEIMDQLNVILYLIQQRSKWKTAPQNWSQLILNCWFLNMLMLNVAGIACFIVPASIVPLSFNELTLCKDQVIHCSHWKILIYFGVCFLEGKSIWLSGALNVSWAKRISNAAVFVLNVKSAKNGALVICKETMTAWASSNNRLHNSGV